MLGLRALHLDHQRILQALHPQGARLPDDQLHGLRILQAPDGPRTAALHLHTLPSRGGPMMPDSLVILLMVLVLACLLLSTRPADPEDTE